MSNNFKVDFVIDAGKNELYIYDVAADSSVTIYTKGGESSLIDWISNLKAGTNVICEYAHLGVPRTRKSLAQTFDADTLLTIYDAFESAEVTLKLFPHDSTPRARQWCMEHGHTDGAKNDENDCRSIALFVNNHDDSEVSLMNPPESFEPTKRRLDGYEFKDILNMTLNVARSTDYSLEHNPLMKIVEDNIDLLHDHLSERSREVLRLTKGKKGVTGTTLKKVRSVIFTMAATVFDDEGEPMLRYGRVPGWCFIKRYVLCMSPCHRKGGVARSNLFYHGFRNFLKRENKDITDIEIDGETYPVNFSRTYKYNLRSGDEVDVKIKRGHMNPGENAVFLQKRKEYCDMLREVQRFYASMVR